MILDLEVVAVNYNTIKNYMGPTDIFYAVKANPDERVLIALANLGASFDAASPGEIDSCLAIGVDPSRISYGNTVKKSSDIKTAFERGIRLFAFDAYEELEKLAKAAPGSDLFCRVLVDSSKAQWPLARKSGCSPTMALELIQAASKLGFAGCGLSFHAGSQQTDMSQWQDALQQIGELQRILAARGLAPAIVNLGGGFPGTYQDGKTCPRKYCQTVMQLVSKHLDLSTTRLIAEPGRGIVADAGVVEAEVVLISTKGNGDGRRWVYLDVGVFSGLVETANEAIRYLITTEAQGGACGPVVIAGPTCDSVDILYERASYHLPLSLKIGDRVQILNAGAYTASTSSIGFNGFPPLQLHVI